MYFFSIIVPVYKVEAYLDECIKSVLSQTFTDYECIVVDDGSPDNCPAMCDEYANKYERLRAIHKENGGLSDARNVGILAARGDYIVLLDSDDYLADRDALKNLAMALEKTRCPVAFNAHFTSFVDAFSEFDVVDRMERDASSYNPIDFYQEVEKKDILLTAWSFVLRRDFLLSHGLFFEKGRLHEDEHWIPRAVCNAPLIAINHMPFYTYRKGRAGSIMAVKNPKRLYDIIATINDLLAWEKSNDYPSGNKIIFRWRAVFLWKDLYASLPSWSSSHPLEYAEISQELARLKLALDITGE